MNNIMSLRDQMALQILNGLLSSRAPVAKAYYVNLVCESYEIADLMIEESKNNSQQEKQVL